MPEGPELHLTSLFINKQCKNRLFSGKVFRNPIHKCAEIIWDKLAYTLTSESRGKELMLHLHTADVKSAPSQKQSTSFSLSILFNFGMSGRFEFTSEHELHKHSHLIFYTVDEPKMALSFVDPRRFGKWTVTKQWSSGRGPCVMQEYDDFVNNIITNINNPVFKRPICEALLNQTFFNGIGNYLRAEILYRCSIAPFEKASEVLQLDEKDEAVKSVHKDSDSTKGKKKRPQKKLVVSNEDLTKHWDTAETSIYFKTEATGKKPVYTNPSAAVKDECVHLALKSMTDLLTPKAQELLRLCHSVPLEVVQLGSSKYTLTDLYKEVQEDGSESFNDWLQCYYQPGMKNMADHNKRTIWFTGPAGPLAPKDSKSRVIKMSKQSSKTSKETAEVSTESSVDISDSSKTSAKRQKQERRKEEDGSIKAKFEAVEDHVSVTCMTELKLAEERKEAHVKRQTRLKSLNNDKNSPNRRSTRQSSRKRKTS